MKWLLLLIVFPIIDLLLPAASQIVPQLRPVLIFAFYGFALHVVTGRAGILHLGIAGFAAIGAYVYSIASSDLYPFQLGFWGGLLAAIVIGGIIGWLLSLPTLRLRGDYLAMVTLGFSEIVQDSLKNLERITKGTQGINPVPYPTIGSYEITPEQSVAWYYLLLVLIAVAYVAIHHLERSHVGRAWEALREDPLVAGFMRVPVAYYQLVALIIAASFASMGGALWASSLGSSGEPSNYDFQVSVIALCIIIIGGLGSLRGVIVGAFVMVGMNSLVLTRLADVLNKAGLVSTTTVWSSPNNWKYGVFGLALIVVMRCRPSGLCPRVEASKTC